MRHDDISFWRCAKGWFEKKRVNDDNNAEKMYCMFPGCSWVILGPILTFYYAGVILPMSFPTSAGIPSANPSSLPPPNVQSTLCVKTMRQPNGAQAPRALCHLYIRNPTRFLNGGQLFLGIFFVSVFRIFFVFRFSRKERKEGRNDGRMEGWKDGRMEGWKEGRKEGRKEGWMDGWMDGCKNIQNGMDACVKQVC